jgi:hypothetical protein
VALTNVVVRATPFQRTPDEATKLLPLTVSVVAALPATALAGERLLATGTGDPVAVVLKVAVTVALAFIAHAQDAEVPVQAPLQLTNVEPLVAAAVRVIDVPAGTDEPQVAPHEMPAGALVTVPAPVPPFVTDSANVDPAVVEPVTLRETVSPPAVTFTLPAKVPAVVGRKRTVAT